MKPPTELKALTKLTKFHKCALVPLEINESNINTSDQGIYVPQFDTTVSYNDIYFTQQQNDKSIYVCNDTFYKLTLLFYSKPADIQISNSTPSSLLLVYCH